MVALKELSVFLLKPLSAVVFALLGDVLPHGLQIRLGNGKSTVPRLPRKPLKIQSLRLNPLRRCLFDILDGLTDGHGADEVKKKVRVVCHGIDKNGSASQVLQNLAPVGVERLANGIGDTWFTIFGAEDEGDVKSGEGLRHAGVALVVALGSGRIGIFAVPDSNILTST